MKSRNAKELPVLPPGVTLPGCLSCGTCCQDMEIPLTEEEFHTLDAHGTIFSLRRGPNSKSTLLNDGRRLYKMVGRCANLMEDPQTGQFTCRIYTSPERPAICAEFPEGGRVCRMVQARRGVITPEHLEQPGAEAYLGRLIFGADDEERSE